MTPQFENLKRKLKNVLELAEREVASLTDYKKELQELNQEKMVHVEELRLIHADISSMENVIKQSELDHRTHYESAKSLYQEYQQIKQMMDRMRNDLNLPRLPELHEEDERFKQDFFAKQKFSEYMHSQSNTMEDHVNSSLLAAANIPQSYLAAASAARSIKPVTGGGALSLTHGSGLHTNPSSSVTGPNTDRPVPPSSFRQQPPPMKSCLSCHQQIHRNAPICPLCKAKSKSRNPKKPKRKTED